ncbi:unnamed protein product [Prorocentrum cordatum]|uniref:F-box domain-containing protein n=1 Tax=Prorocentrum cordatum TaxID=2364126 RepID=A0ABN9T7U1_9DINO|nr:unnamed protein product [Polarella glacialis]
MDGYSYVHTPLSASETRVATSDRCYFSLDVRAATGADEAVKTAAKAAAGCGLLRSALGWPPGRPADGGRHAPDAGSASARAWSDCASRADCGPAARRARPPLARLEPARLAEDAQALPRRFMVDGILPAPAFWIKAVLPGAPRQPPAGQRGRGAGVLDLPSEVLQAVLMLLPTFRERARACRACKGVRCLDWRLGPPRQLDEELAGIGLWSRGAAAVAEALASPLNAGLGELCLGSNGIGDAGACAIAEVLEAGVTIRW